MPRNQQAEGVEGGADESNGIGRNGQRS